MAGNFAKIDQSSRLLLGGRVSQLHVWPKRGAGRRFGTIAEGEKKRAKERKGKEREGETVLSEFCVVGRRDTPRGRQSGVIFSQKQEPAADLW